MIAGRELIRFHLVSREMSYVYDTVFIFRVRGLHVLPVWILIFSWIPAGYSIGLHDTQWSNVGSRGGPTGSLPGDPIGSPA